MPVKLFYDDGDGVSSGVRPSYSAYDWTGSGKKHPPVQRLSTPPLTTPPVPERTLGNEDVGRDARVRFNAGASPLHPQDGKISVSDLALITMENATGQKHTIVNGVSGRWVILPTQPRQRGRPSTESRYASGDYRLVARRIGERFSRDEIYERDKGKCYLCGGLVSPARWHMEHIKPLSRGGSHTRANVAVTCPPCNLQKWAHYDPPEAPVS